jgi:hypothetical protein
MSGRASGFLARSVQDSGGSLVAPDNEDSIVLEIYGLILDKAQLLSKCLCLGLPERL